MALTKSARYVMTDVSANNNKFWMADLYDDGTVITRWGRVGDDGQCLTSPNVGEPFFQRKCREKESKGYRPLRTLENGPSGASSNANLELVASRQIDTGDDEAARLIARLARANVHQILEATSLQYDTSKGTFSTPLGIVTQDALDEARRLLTRIGDFVEQQHYADAQFARAVSDYFMLVPQQVGRKRPDLQLLYPDLAAVQKQNSLLDALEVSLQNVLAVPATDDAPKDEEKLFDVKLRRVEDGDTIERIRRKYRETQQGKHACAHLDVKAVYAVEIAAMQQAFEAQGRPLGFVNELWHGTKIANLLSILRSGLRVSPPASAHVTGKMWGNGIYASDQSTKALNYAYGYWSGQRSDNCFMLLLDIAMGKTYVPSSYTEKLPKPGYDSTFAKAGVSGVINNEMIVYRNEQVNIKYLVEFSPQGK